MTYLDYFPHANSLVESMREAGVLEDREVSITNDSEEAVIEFKHNGCTIDITVGEFWQFPGEVCYFVNVTHPNGNFMCQSGTNRVMRAAINVGTALHFANVSGDPLQSEDL
jgi:hypothetical protein